MLKALLRHTLFFCLAVFGLWSCKVSYSLSGATIPEEAKTVTVEFFENMAALANVNYQQDITEALRDKFQRETRLKLVSDEGDLLFRGVIVGYQTTPLAITGQEAAALTRLTITLKVTYVNKFDDKQSFDQTFTRYLDFDATQSLDVAEPTLLPEITKLLVQDVFNRAFLNW
jgi:hypothetical protein